MTRMVTCRKDAKSLAGLESAPLPVELGQRIFETVSKKAWEEWQAIQTMLINEHHFNLRDKEARAYLTAQRELFLDNGDYEKPAGYVPPAPE